MATRPRLLYILIWGLAAKEDEINAVLTMADYEVLSKKEIESLPVDARIGSISRDAHAMQATVSPGVIEKERGDLWPLVDDETVAVAKIKPVALDDRLRDTVQTDSERLTAVERIAEEELFYYPGGHVSAIRLYGAADRYISAEELKIYYRHKPYEIPPELRPYAEARITELRNGAKSKGTNFFDGPNVRLAHWQATPPEQGPGAAVERDVMKLFLEPIGWFDYEGTNGFVREELNLDAPEPYEYWIGLSKLVNDFSVRHSKLSNIFGNAITIFTRDGKVGYQERRYRQSAVPGQLTSAVAENTNRPFDETYRRKPLRLVNSFPYGMKLSDGPDNGYRPVKGVPHPVAAVLRGLNEEASSRMTEFVPKGGIKFTGLAFGLDSLHPDALWIALVNLTADAFTQECRIHRGTDWHEGRIRFVPANFDNNETQSILKQSSWVPGDKASLVRAIELIQEVGTKQKIPVTDVFDLLART